MKMRSLLTIVLSCASALAACGARPMPEDLWGGTELDFAKTTLRAMETKKGTDDKAEIRLSPGSWVDGTYHLTQNQVSLLTFVIKGKPEHREEFRVIEKEDVALRNQAKPDYQMLVELDLPDGVELIDVSAGQLVASEKTSGGTHCRFAMAREFDWTFTMPFAISDQFNWWRSMGFLFTTKVRPGTELGDACVWMSWKGRRFTNVDKFSFKVVPSIPKVPAFKSFYYGAATGGPYVEFSESGFDKWSKMFVDAGLNAIQHDSRVSAVAERQLAALRKNGVRLITPNPNGACPVQNGYFIGHAEGRPANESFVTAPEILANAKGGHLRDLKGAVCPSSVYERMPFFMTNTVPALARAYAGYDGIWCNWEPFAYFGNGCFCERCKGKFAAFAGKDLADVASDWPKNVRRGGRFHRSFVRFSSVEHGKMAAVLQEELVKVCGGAACKAGFIPGVAWCEMASNWRTSDYAREVQPIDYADKLKWISPWGPYAIYPLEEPYRYAKWRNLRTFLAAKDVRAQVDKDYPASVRPKLMAYPHGRQGSWILYPEALTMNNLSFFFNGWEAVCNYFFPCGYDARWIKAFADAGRLASQYEDVVFGGARVDGKVSLELTAPFAAPNSVTGTATRGLDIKKPMLQHVAYEKDGRTYVAVFNFWEKGPAFFRVTIDGADRGEFYCGAMRCKVFAFGAGVTRDFSDADVAVWKAQVLPALERAVADDARFEAQFGERSLVLGDRTIGTVKGVADVQAGTVTFRDGADEIVFDAHRMVVRSWKRGGRPVCEGPVGTVAFAKPAEAFKDLRFRLKEQKDVGPYAYITAEAEIARKDSAALAHLGITRTVYFYKTLSKVEMVTSYVNRSTDEEPKEYDLAPDLAAPAGVCVRVPEIQSFRLGRQADKERQIRVTYTVP